MGLKSLPFGRNLEAKWKFEQPRLLCRKFAAVCWKINCNFLSPPYFVNPQRRWKNQTCHQRRRGLKSKGGRKLQFSDRHVHISDRWDYGCSEFQLRPHIPLRWGTFSTRILYFWKKIFGQEDNFPTGYNLLVGGNCRLPPLSRRHCSLWGLEGTKNTFWPSQSSLVETST